MAQVISSLRLSRARHSPRDLGEMGVPVIECYEPDERHSFDDKYTVRMIYQGQISRALTLS